MNDPLISIIVPVYGVEKYIERYARSIFEQTYRNFELILVNDCSSHPVEPIIKSYDDPRIRYYVNDHNYGGRNLVDNWNYCLEYVTGEYVINMGASLHVKLVRPK